MPASDRVVVYNREFRATPVWMWLAQRLSGVLLGPLVVIHMWSKSTAASAVLSAILLACILVHGYTGIRRIALKKGKFALVHALTVLWFLVVAFFGVLIVVYH